MAVFRSLRALARNPKKFLTLSLSSSSPSSTPFSPRSNPFISPSPFTSGSTNFLSPLSKWMTMIPFHGPLFLSSPPWMLSQSATPLYFQSDAVLSLPKISALEILQRQSRSFPIKLRFVPGPSLLAGTHTRELANVGANSDGFTDCVVNLPNLISMSRMLSGPLLGWMIQHDMFISAFIGLGISGATDWLDGYLARKMGINSVVGSYLDPLADKVLIGCVALAMVDRGLLHPGLVAIVVLRDVALVGGAFYKRAVSLDWKRKSSLDFFNLDGTHAEKVEPLLISKVNTVFQLVLVAAALLQPVFGNLETQAYITYLSWLVASTTVSSTMAYGAQHLRNKSMLIAKS